MTRRKLVFFPAADPRSNPRPVWSAYHFATVASGAGLEAEVRLAGDAVRIAQPDGVEDTSTGEEARHKALQGAPPTSSPFDRRAWTPVSVSKVQMNSIGGVRSSLADILTEVADGRSEFIYLG
jgi:hypothetical protein